MYRTKCPASHAKRDLFMGVCLQSVGVWGGGGLTQSVLKYATYLNKKVSQLNINLCAFSRSVTWTVRLHHVQVASEGSRLWKTRAWGGGASIWWQDQHQHVPCDSFNG